ncbi:MAG: TIGR03663 family protein [Chloroflexi bacterium]|nr:TIGR03663 family protein [Chloroflexota bacterium]
MVRVWERPRQAEVPAVPVPESPAVERMPVRDWSWVPFALIMLVALGLRLFDLGARAMHHDESLHALYSWYLYQGRGYVHDPLMHGPVLFHVTAFLFLLFGDNEVTARLPMALSGTAAVFLPYYLRHELGRYGAIAASLMLALGPAFLYFSRFGHNEGIIVFESLLIVVGLFGPARVFLYAAAVGLGLLLATKVVFYILAFIIASFVGVALVVERYRPFQVSVADAIRDIGWRRLGICAAIVLGIGTVLYTTFFTNLAGLCTAVLSPPIGPCEGKQGMLQYWFGQQEVARGGQPWFYYLLLIPLYEVVPLVLSGAALFLARRPRTLFFWFTLWWAVLSIIIYSAATEKMPWLMVHPALPLVILGALALDEPLSRLRRPWGLTGRQWAVVGLVILSLAALVAWATAGGEGADSPLAEQTAALRRIALALVVAGVVAGGVWVASSLSRRQALGAIGAGLLGLLVVYAIHTGWQLTYKNGDVPVEMAVYVQSSPDIPYIVGAVERIGNELGLREDVPILLDGGYTETLSGEPVVHESVSWPFEWYFRDYGAKEYFSRDLPPDFSTGRYAAVLVMGTNLDPIRDQLTGYTGNRYRLNWWYPEDYKQLTWGTVLQTFVDPVARAKLAGYVIHRELMNPPLGARELYFYVRNDLTAGGTAVSGEGGLQAQPSPSAEPSAPLPARLVSSYGQAGGQAALRDPKSVAVDSAGRVYVVDGTSALVAVFNPDGSLLRQWGRPGTGDGEFNEPWGIAVAPDGSVVVADTWNHRVQKFDAEGRFLAKWGTFGAAPAPSAFYGPRDVAIAPNGNVLVTDTGNKRIQVFDQQGTFLQAYGTEGTGPGQFREPVGIDVDSQGRIYIADTWNRRIQVLDAAFEPVAQYPVDAWASQSIVNKPYVTVTPDGDIFATVPERQSVVRVRDGAVSSYALPGTPRVRTPVGLDLDREGHLLVVDMQGPAVMAYELEPSVPASG